MLGSINDLAKLTNDCSGCYAIPGTVQRAMHNVTTSYWHNVQKLPYNIINLPTITYCGHFLYSSY